jgi:4-amino-4-deoxy-L-arabinose transferase-like glycosyltransferase
MENEAPTAEQLVPDIEKRKKSLKNFFFGWITTNYDKLFLIVLLAAFIIRILVYTKTQDQALWWDAADYMASAKRWGLGLDTIDIWYYRRGFLWPLIGALFFKLGLGELSIRFLVVLLSTGIVFVTYQLIATMFDKRLALLTSIPVAFSWVFMFFTGRPLTNLPSTFFLLLAILFFWKAYILNQGKKYFILFGMFYALACLIRMQYLMFGLSFLALAIVKEKHKFLLNKGLWISVIIFFIIFIPQFTFQNQYFGNPIQDLATYYLGIGGSESGEVGVKLTSVSNLFVYFKNIPYVLDANQAGYSSLFVISTFYILFIIGFILFFLDLLLGFDKIFKSQLIQKKFFILFWIISTFLFLGYIAPHLEQRYIMPIIPILFMIAVYPIYLAIPYINKKVKLKPIIIFIGIALILAYLMMPNYEFGNQLIDSKVHSYEEVKQAGEWIKANSEPSDIIVGSGLPQLSYYSERSVYPFELAYRRDLEKKNLQELEEFIEKERPVFLVASAYEPEEEWARTFPETHQDMLTAVAGFPATDQPRVIVFRFNYPAA